MLLNISCFYTFSIEGNSYASLDHNFAIVFFLLLRCTIVFQDPSTFDYNKPPLFHEYLISPLSARCLFIGRIFHSPGVNLHTLPTPGGTFCAMSKLLGLLLLSDCSGFGWMWHNIISSSFLFLICCFQI